MEKMDHGILRLASSTALESISGLPSARRKCNGIIGVPITFLDKYNPKQFGIIGLDRYVENNPKIGHRFTIAEKETYARVLVAKV